MPFWVEWGDAIWPIAFILSVGWAAGWRWSSPRRQAKRETQRWIVEPTGVDRFEEGANTIIEGTLEGGHDSILLEGATIASIQGLATGAIDQVPIAISVDDEIIELEGPMRLMLGSEEIRPRATFHRDGPLHARVCALPDGPLAAAQLEGQPYVIRWLKAGDRIQARGVLRRSAAQGESGYRETQGRWVLRGSPQRPLTLGSATRPRMAQRDVDRLAIGAVRGGLLFAAIFIGFASLLHNGIDPDQPSETIASILTMTPLHRDDGLEMLRHEWQRDPSRDALERLAELVEMKDGCQGAAMLWTMHGKHDRAIVLADACDHPVAALAAARAYYALGDMAEASRALQDVRDELELDYSPTLERTMSREDHAIGATRAHLARARWRTASRELDRVWTSDASCVANVARKRAELDPLLSTSSSEACLLLEASEQTDPAMVQMFRHTAVGRLLMRETDPGIRVYPRRERSHYADQRLTPSELALGVPEDPTCPIDPRGAPGLERSVLTYLLELQGGVDDGTRELLGRLAVRRALLEAVAGRQDRVDAFMRVARRINPAQAPMSDVLAMWDPNVTQPHMTDDAARSSWNDATRDRDALIRGVARTESTRDWVELGRDRPVLGTFREHFCDASARAVAAKRAGMSDLAREQREIAERFRHLLEGRRASIMLWVLDRNAD